MNVVLNGYNQWPDHWPKSIPGHLWWPVVMLGTAGWPYQYRGLTTNRGFLTPESYPDQYVAEWTTSAFDLNVWTIRPTIIEGLTVTTLTAKLLGTVDEPTGIEWVLTFLQQTTTNYSQGIFRIIYDQPLDFTQTPQTRTLVFSVFNDGEINDFLDIEFRLPNYCGQVWELGKVS